jgi:Circularly permutated YpsA SLOG family/Domain of unknown function (DUF6794)
MLKRIISGGQTGADRAALDVAIELGIPHGGWIPKGRKTEDGVLPDKYHLKEMPTGSYPKCIKQNVIDSEGTLIISHGKITGGSGLAWACAEKYNRPYLHVDLNSTSPFSATKAISYWLTHHDIEVLNVAGPRLSKDPDIYDATVSLLKSAVHLDIIDTAMPDPSVANPLVPATVAEAVDDLISILPLSDKAIIAKMKEEELADYYLSFGTYMRNKYGMWSTNKTLLESCRSSAGEKELNPEDASALIVKEMWKKLKETHGLRVVK